MVLVRVRDVRYLPFRGVGIDKHIPAAVLEVVPFKVWSDVLCSADDVGVHSLLALGAATRELEELLEGLLEGLDDVGFEGAEVLLDGEQVLLAVVFFENLLVQHVLDSAMEDVWVITRIDLATC